MKKYLILCVDDEREVLDSVTQDLASFEEYFVVEAAESVAEARDVISEFATENTPLALILCDHIMPDQTGISFLIELEQNLATKHARKLLLTGQAGLEETVEAINHASLDFYIAKPWQGKNLVNVVTEQLTTYMIENEPELMPWGRALNTERIFNAISDKRSQFGE